MSISIFSSPAKVILFGEHSVLYGHCALSMAIPLRTIVSKEVLCTGKGFTFVFPQLKEEYKIPPQSSSSSLSSSSNGTNSSLLKDVFEILYLKFYKGNKMKITITSEIPIGSGLGSSAALCTALAGAFLETCDEHLVYDLSLYLENVFHGRSSGIDVMTSLCGGTIICKGSNDVKRANIFAKTKINLTFPFYVINSNINSSTKKMVSLVKQRRFDLVQEFKEIDKIIENITKKEACFKNINSSIAAAQKLLSEKFGISTSLIDQLVHCLAEQGLYFKITGAGGGGCLIGGFGCVDIKEIEKISTMIIPDSTVFRIEEGTYLEGLKKEK